MINIRRKPTAADKETRRALDLIKNGTISLLNPDSFRISDHEVVVERKNIHGFGILSIPVKFRSNRDLSLLLDYFTTHNYFYVNISISSKEKLYSSAKYFLNFMASTYGNTIFLPHVISAYLKHLKNSNHTAHSIKDLTSQLRKMFRHAADKNYPRSSETPDSIKQLLNSLDLIQIKNPPSRKKPPLGPYLSISHLKFSNRELLFGIRLGTIWLLKKLHEFRKELLKAPDILNTINSCRGMTEENINKMLLCNGHKVYKLPTDDPIHKASVEHWKLILNDPLLIEWQFYEQSAFSRHSLIYSDKREPRLFDESSKRLFLSRFLDKDDTRIRDSAKGYGQKDLAWRVFRPVYRAARHTKRVTPVMWGLPLLTHTPLEKVLFTWLLASERMQSEGIKSLPISGIVTSGEEPKTIQLTWTKWRKKGKSSPTKLSTVQSPLYRKKNPPFQVYLNWKRMCVSARDSITDHNPEGLALVHSSTALKGKLLTDNHQKTHTPLRLLITTGTQWQETFLSENAGTPREAQAFIEVLKTRLLPDCSSEKLLSLPPDPICQSVVVEKELESNISEENSEINSVAIGHTVETGRAIYKDGFISAEIAEIIEPVNSFIRRVGDERYKAALALSEHLKHGAQRLSILELQQLCGITDTANDVEKLLCSLADDDKLLISGEILQGSTRIIVETDFTAAIMHSYIEHLESSLPTIINSERTDTSTRLLAQLIFLTQTLKSFSPDIQKIGVELAKQLKFKFPSVS